MYAVVTVERAESFSGLGKEDWVICIDEIFPPSGLGLPKQRLRLIQRDAFNFQSPSNVLSSVATRLTAEVLFSSI